MELHTTVRQFKTFESDSSTAIDFCVCRPEEKKKKKKRPTHIHTLVYLDHISRGLTFSNLVSSFTEKVYISSPLLYF